MGMTLTWLLKPEASVQYGSHRAQSASTLSEILTQWNQWQNSHWLQRGLDFTPNLLFLFSAASLLLLNGIAFPRWTSSCYAQWSFPLALIKCCKSSKGNSVFSPFFPFSAVLMSSTVRPECHPLISLQRFVSWYFTHNLRRHGFQKFRW